MPPRRSFNRNVPARRKRVWARKAGTNAIVLSGITPIAQDLLDVFELQAGQMVGCTIARTKLDIYAEVDVGGLDQAMIIQGLVVAPANADADDMNPSGTSSSHIDWMWWKNWFLQNEASTGTAPTRVTSLVVDVKAMRKMEELGETLYWVGVNPDAGMTMSVRVASSVLLMLP